MLQKDGVGVLRVIYFEELQYGGAVSRPCQGEPLYVLLNEFEEISVDANLLGDPRQLLFVRRVGTDGDVERLLCVGVLLPMAL